MHKSEAFVLAVATLGSGTFATQIVQSVAMRPTMLAQTNDYWQYFKNYCQDVHERIKNSEDIFYEKQGGTEEFVDDTFPLETMVRNSLHPATGSDFSSILDKITYIDSIDIRFSDSDYSLFGEEYPKTGHATDIYQG